MENNPTQELRQYAVRIEEELIEAHTKNVLPEYIYENALSIEKDEDNTITHILFTYGGPTVYLDFEDSPGVIIASHMEFKSQAAIPLSIWTKIRNELEELNYEN